INPNTIAKINFGVCLKPASDYRFVPTAVGVQMSLVNVLQDTIEKYEAIDGNWQNYDVSEDYGEARKVRLARAEPLAVRLSNLFDMDAMADVGNIIQLVPNVEFYFAQFWDDQGRKAIGVAKSPQFKAHLGAQGRIWKWQDDVLSIVEGNVFRIERFFDAVITSEAVYMSKPRAVEAIADIVSEVANTAAAKIDIIEAGVTFLDLSRIKADIGSHPRMARLAAAIAKRDDLADISQDRLGALCLQQGIGLKEIGGKLQPVRRSEYALLEALDHRRYTTQLTVADPLAFRASGRQRVEK
ncbi:MAG: DUF4868 domain-containing protein, partial [Alphaproteobacteria bacterium]